MTADDWIHELKLQPHPEGGFYRETYRAETHIPGHVLPHTPDGDRSVATGIYFLLPSGTFSAFHRVRSDEMWHFYAGGRLSLHLVDADGHYRCEALNGDGAFQVMVPAGVWQAAVPEPGSDYVLAGCTVSPGFEFADFAIADANELAALCPEQRDLVLRYCT